MQIAKVSMRSSKLVASEVDDDLFPNFNTKDEKKHLKGLENSHKDAH